MLFLGFGISFFLVGTGYGVVSSTMWKGKDRVSTKKTLFPTRMDHLFPHRPKNILFFIIILLRCHLAQELQIYSTFLDITPSSP